MVRSFIAAEMNASKASLGAIYVELDEKDGFTQENEEIEENSLIESGVTIHFDCGECLCQNDRSFSCQRRNCSLDCRLTEWSEWTACSTSCGPGKRRRTRDVLAPAEVGGRQCQPSDFYDLEECNITACVCSTSQWGQWSPCSQSCDGGLRRRTRNNVGSNCERDTEEQTELCSTTLCSPSTGCPSPKERRPCVNITCPLTCDHVTDASACSESLECDSTGHGCFCAEGKVWDQTKSQCVEPPNCPCNLEALHCPACTEKVCVGGVGQCVDSVHCDCQWAEWQTWQPCSAECDGGNQTRLREHRAERRGGGAVCQGPADQTQPCNSQACPICFDENSFWYQSGETMPADSVCEKCYCDYHTSQRKCVPQDPAKFDAPTWSQWSDWTACTGECGHKTRERQRICYKSCDSDSRSCTPETNGTGSRESQHCNITEPYNCEPPVDCSVETEWTNGTCVAVCDGVSGEAHGMVEQTRLILIHPLYGGKECPETKRTQPCTRKCVVDCELSEWQVWSASCELPPCETGAGCDQTCGYGHRVRTRSVTVEPQNGGKTCVTEEYKTCHKPCENTTCLAPMVQSNCSNRCHLRCADLAATLECAESACEPGCACPDNEYMQDGKCVPKNECACAWDASLLGPAPADVQNGRAPPGYTLAKECNNCTCSNGAWHCTDKDCRKDCVYSDWSGDGVCNVTCGSGKTKVKRTITEEAQYGGKECTEPLEKWDDCFGENGKCCDLSTVYYDTRHCDQTCADVIGGTQASTDDCNKGCHCPGGKVKNSNGTCVPTEDCYKCVVDGVVHESGYNVNDMTSCLQRSCLQGTFTETPLDASAMPPCTNLDRDLELRTTGGKRVADTSRCCYTISLPSCAKANITIKQIFTPDGLVCDLQTPLQGSRCEGTCPSDCVVTPEVYESYSEAQINYILEQHAGLFGSQVSTLCSCCHPTRESTESPVTATCTNIPGRSFVVNVKQVASCTCDRPPTNT